MIFFLRDKTGKFPDYPDDDEGGSAAIFKEKDPAEVTFNSFSGNFKVADPVEWPGGLGPVSHDN